jgi:hypothetical protein
MSTAQQDTRPNLSHWTDRQLIMIMHNPNVSHSGRMAACAELQGRARA